MPPLWLLRWALNTHKEKHMDTENLQYFKKGVKSLVPQDGTANVDACIREAIRVAIDEDVVVLFHLLGHDYTVDPDELVNFVKTTKE